MFVDGAGAKSKPSAGSRFESVAPLTPFTPINQFGTAHLATIDSGVEAE